MRKRLIIFSLLLQGGIFAQGEIADSLFQYTDVSIVATKIDKLPGSGEIIDSKELMRLNQTDINRVLRSVPGLQIRDEEGFGLRPNIGMRGTSVNRSAKITLMEDGVLTAPAPYADPSAYYFPTFARMEGVEILKGSSQIKYGPFTIGGALNLRSTSIPSTTAGQFIASYGMFGTNQQRLWIGDSGQHFDYVFDVNRLASAGFKELDNGGKTGFDRRDFMAKFRWHNLDTQRWKHSIALKLVYMGEAGDESYLGLTYQDFNENPMRRYAATSEDYLDMNHQAVTLAYEANLPGQWRVNATTYLTHTYRDWARINSVNGVSLNAILNNTEANNLAYDVMRGSADGWLGFQGADRTYDSRGLQVNAVRFFSIGNTRHELQIGARYHEDQADRFATLSQYEMVDGWMRLLDAGERGNSENQLRKAISASAYVQYDVRYGGLTITPGLRVEQIKLQNINYGTADFARWGLSATEASNDVLAVMPGVGFNFAFLGQMSIFGGVHKGFSPPGTPVASNGANQANSETAINYELGYRMKSNVFKGQIAGFYSDYANILGSDNVSAGGVGTGNMFNAGNAVVKGLECSLDFSILELLNGLDKSDLNFNVTYTFSDARFADDFINAGGDWGNGEIKVNDYIPFVTPHLLTSSLVYEAKKYNLSITGRYVGLTRIKPGQKEVQLPADDMAYTSVNAMNPYLVFDLSSNYHFSEMVTVYCSVSNLLNKTYIVANLPQGYRPGMPFSALAGVKIKI
jgi:Fe(3+) dicitrate transport protein